MNAEMAQKVADWLNSLPHCRDAVPVQAEFAVDDKPRSKRFVFYGASYFDVDVYNSNHPAVECGDRKAGEEQLTPVIYLIGERPKIPLDRRGEGKFAYTIPGGDGDWYASSYARRADINYSEWTQVKKYHPFGSNFSFRRWPHEDLGERIDRHQSKRERLRLLITQL
jgi:hypothetical protein